MKILPPHHSSLMATGGCSSIDAVFREQVAVLPIFNYMDPMRLLDALLAAGGQTIAHFSQFIRQRYKDRHMLYREFGQLLEFQTLLNERMAEIANWPFLKQFAFKQLSNTMIGICGEEMRNLLPGPIIESGEKLAGTALQSGSRNINHDPKLLLPALSIQSLLR